jgi:energy-converting hydrogenase A subunit M
LIDEKQDMEHTASMFETIHTELETAKLECQQEWNRLEFLKTELEQAQALLLQQSEEIARKDTEVASRERRVKLSPGSLKEKRQQLYEFEQSLVERESSLDERNSSKDSSESRYISKLERRDRRQPEDLAYERVQLDRARSEVERMKATVHQKMKLMDTTESSNELRRINKMLQESYLTPRDVVTPGSTEDSPLISLR